MRGSWRLLLGAAVLSVAVGAEAQAQTVILIKAPAGANIEVTLNGSVVGTGAANAEGEARIAIRAFPTGEAAEKSIHISVDACDAVRRVVLVERNRDIPPPAVGCTRRDVAGYFVLRPVTTFVIDVGSTYPDVRLRQGPVPAAWLHPDLPPPPPRVAARGFTAGGGVGSAALRDALFFQCGSGVGNCSGAGPGPAVSASVGYWPTRIFGGEVSYIRPVRAKIEGDADAFDFTTFVDVHAFNFTGNIGVPIRAVRPYGMIGATYHLATTTTNEVINEKTVVVDGVPQVVPGGTISYVLKTSGWAWTWGVGFEIWAKPRFAIYLEGAFSDLQGDNRNDTEGAMDDRLKSIVIGGRIRIGGS